MPLPPQLGSTRRRGWIPSSKPARHAFAAHHAALMDTTPRSVDHQSKAPRIMDQGDIASCWGHATSRGIATALEIAGSPLGFVPSQDDLYRLARCLMRARNGAARPRLTDTGTSPHIGNQVLSLFGVRAMRGPTSDGRYSDCDDATFNDEPDLGSLIADSKHILIGDYGITSWGSQRILDMRKALAATSVTGGFFCDTGFERWQRGNAPYGAPRNPNDPQGGGHMITYDGYDTMQNGSTVFIIANSWSEGWGDDGRCLVDEEFVLDSQVSDLTVLAEVSE